jgi:hypothetical protein
MALKEARMKLQSDFNPDDSICWAFGNPRDTGFYDSITETVWVKSPKLCSIAGAAVGYQTPPVNGGSVPLRIWILSKPTLAEAAEPTAAMKLRREKKNAASLKGEYQRCHTPMC